MDDRSTWTCFRFGGTCTLYIAGFWCVHLGIPCCPRKTSRSCGADDQALRRGSGGLASFQSKSASILQELPRTQTASSRNDCNTCKAGGERTPRSSGLKNYTTACVIKNDKRCGVPNYMSKIQSNDMPAVDVLLRSRIVLVD